MSRERLQKVLSRAGVASRRRAEAMILAGQVRVNGQVVRTLGTQVDLGQDTVEVGGERLQPKQDFHYFAYYKPRGLVVTKRDELGRQGIFAELDLPPEVNAVGRLDKDSEGLLLLSDDGDFVQHYTHPSFEVSKVYRVQISRPLNNSEIKQLLAGLPLDGKRARVHSVLPKKRKGPGHWVELELREGKKREIRRLLDQLDIKVSRLIRIAHGSVRLGTLKPGELKVLKKRPRVSGS